MRVCAGNIRRIGKRDETAFKIVLFVPTYLITTNNVAPTDRRLSENKRCACKKKKWKETNRMRKWFGNKRTLNARVFQIDRDNQCEPRPNSVGLCAHCDDYIFYCFRTCTRRDDSPEAAVRGNECTRSRYAADIQWVRGRSCTDESVKTKTFT